MKTEKVKRLEPTPATIKKLFAYSGNQCAIPNCKDFLVDETGAMLGKIAHIHAAEKGGPRFLASMTNEQRRGLDNLMLVCGKHHDIIDYPGNVEVYNDVALRKFKAEHEGRFRGAERQLIEQVSDTTQATLPTYPKTLKRLGEVFGVTEMMDHEEEVEGVRIFIDKLKVLPLEQRAFAVEVARRMRLLDAEKLLVEDVTGAFHIGSTKLKNHMRVLERHVLGCINEGHNYQEYFVELFDRKPGGNPWIEMLDFCDRVGVSIDTLVYDLDFSQYDE
ncbi:hypothetical protein [Agrobacterium burrii]|uniref:HNH endonuclease n=1 Tax=Agrobacterium burrii TaxID=2815339 RepID=A0ABS3EPZ1_9HYPH|nr:hypothetical protein [Agrobacterium burrii]MBO0134076.1 hypothetical protein [Agrobacterium burrii]